MTSLTNAEVKVGDKVRAIEDFGRLIEGEIYTVIRVWNDSIGNEFLDLVDKYGNTEDNCGWFTRRFELYNCGHCGEEGHNRRTCPHLHGGSKGLVTSGFEPGDEVYFYSVPGPHKEYYEGKKGRFKFSVNNGMNPDGSGAYLLKVTERFNDDFGTYNPGDIFTVGHSEWKIAKEIPVEIEKSEESMAAAKVTVWELTERVIPVSRITLLYGPPGTGKTTAGNRIKVNGDQQVFNITLTEETPAAEIRGHYVPVGDKFEPRFGPAMFAYLTGGRLVLNEIDKASGDCLTFCHSLLDDPEVAEITLPFVDEEGETIHAHTIDGNPIEIPPPMRFKPHPNFSVVATMNGEPEDLPEALRDRFAVCIHIDKLHPEAVKSLPVDLRGPAKKGVSGTEGRRVSVRAWKAFDNLRQNLGSDELAARAVFGDRSETILNTIKLAQASRAKKAKATFVVPVIEEEEILLCELHLLSKGDKIALINRKTGETFGTAIYDHCEGTSVKGTYTKPLGFGGYSPGSASSWGKNAHDGFKLVRLNETFPEDPEDEEDDEEDLPKEVLTTNDVNLGDTIMVYDSCGDVVGTGEVTNLPSGYRDSGFVINYEQTAPYEKSDSVLCNCDDGWVVKVIERAK